MLLLKLLCLAALGQCELPSPTNVTIISLNLEHVLKWDPGPGSPTGTQYRVEYLHFHKNWSPVKMCLKITSPGECDLTEEFRDIFKSYVARVQAFTELEQSTWSKSSFFQPISNTILGPPEVTVSGCGDCLHLQVKPPKGKRMDHFLAYYESEYICEVLSATDGRKFTLRISGQRVIEYLKPATEYCVTVKMYIGINQHAILSNPHCVFTSLPHLNKVPVVLGLFCLVFLLSVMVWGFLFYGYILRSL
ncbi:interferon alpha/beta receptor 2 [Amia ocellicauda]|uniref:interferon alpha/beta receptor 2 n=1 Tax=Amia ocellicauda TaxID=2972642 RepID=UPI0034639836